jgi:23S rRNA pseudouridine2605 synthase
MGQNSDSGNTGDTNGVRLLRLNKAIASSGVCSRRKADELIRSGRVRVNERRVTELGRRIDPHRDRVRVDGRIVQPSGGDPQQHAYVALYKPVRVVSTLRDPQGRRTVLDLLPEDLRALRLLPVGRLDYMSEGLLLLTTEGELVNRLIHPSRHVPKGYRVVVSGDPEERKLERMRSGMQLREGERLAPVDVRMVQEMEAGRALLEMTLYQGVNRQIRRMCRDLGLKVHRLVRVSQGPVSLGSLRPGQCRRLGRREVRELRQGMPEPRPGRTEERG